MADNVLGFIAKIDVTDLKAGLSQVKQAIGQTRDEFTASTSGMEKWQTSTEGLSAKLKQLNTNLEAQKKAVELYEKEIERVSSKEGDHSKTLEILSKKLQQAKNSLASTEAQISKYSKSLETAKAKEEEQNSALGKLNSSIKEHETKLKTLENRYKSAVLQYGKYSKEAKAVARQTKETASNLKKEQAQVEKLEKSYKGLTNQAEKYEKVGKTLLKSVAAIGTAVAGAVAGLTKASESTKEFRENQKAIAEGFIQAGSSADVAAKQYEKLYSVIGDDSQVSEVLRFLPQITKNEQELEKWTSALIGVYAKFGNAIPIKELVQNANECAKTSKVVGQLGDALKQIGISEDAFSSMLSTMSTEEERQSFILATLTDNYTELGESFVKNNESLIENNKASLNYTKSLSKIGTIGDDVKKAVTELKTKALDTLYPAILKTVNFVKNNYKWLTGLVVTIGAVGTALLTTTVAIKTYNALIKVATAVQTAWNAAMLANPIGLIVAAIAALVAGIALLIKYWDKVKEAGVKAWEGVKTAWEASAQFFQKLWGSITSGLETAWGNVKGFFVNLWAKITGIFSSAWDGIKKIFEKPGETFQKLVDEIVGFFKDLPKKFLEIGKQMGEALVNGVKEVYKKIKDWWNGNAVGSLPPIEGTISFEQEGFDKVEQRKKKIEESLQDLAKTYNIDYNIVLDIYNKDLDKDLEAIEKQIQILTSNTESSSKKVQELAEETAQSVEENLQRTELAVGTTAEETLNETEQFIADRLATLKEGYEREIALAEGQEQVNAIKKKYAEMLQATDSYYSSYSQGFQGAKDTIVNQLSSLKEEFKTTAEESTEVVNTATLSISDKVKQTMSQVSSTISTYASKISSVFSSITSLIGDAAQVKMDKIDEEWAKYEEEIEKEKTALEEANEAKLEEIEEQYEEEQELRDQAKEKELDENAKAYKEGLIDDKQYFLNKYKIESKYADLGEKKEKEKADSIQSFNDQLTAHLKALEDEKLAKEQEALEEKNKAAKTQFEAQKANDIATTWINAAVAIVKAFAELGPIGGAVMTAVITGLAAAQTAIIASKEFTPYTALAEGGVIDKPTYALVGEDGKEAVLPLEKNTGWIRELAEQLNELSLKDFSMGAQSITAEGVNYYGDTINNYNYEQTINSPKALTRAEIYKDSKNLLSLKKY